MQHKLIIEGLPAQKKFVTAKHTCYPKHVQATKLLAINATNT